LGLNPKSDVDYSAADIIYPLPSCLHISNYSESNYHEEIAFAFDFVLIPFYGAEQNKGDAYKDLKQGKGNTRFFAYASIYIVLKNKRYTLAGLFYN